MTRMRVTSRWLIVSTGLVAAIVASGCGGDDAEETCVSEITGVEVPCNRNIAVSEAEYAELKAEEEAERAEAEARAERLASECDRQLGEFLELIGDLDSRLSVGLAYQDYSTRVGDVLSEYDRIEFKALGLECGTTVGIPAENAMRHYVNAHDTWGDCVADFDCDTDSIDPELQRHWATAANLLERADSSLDRLEQPQLD